MNEPVIPPAVVSLREGDWLEHNRANWNERVAVHLGAPDFYDREPLRAGGATLDPIVTRELAELYPGGLGRLRILHLQCHFGSDTLSFANQGASVVGLDFSHPAVVEARRMAVEIGVDGLARFVEANVYDARDALAEPDSFDLVFASWGVIGWLPDLAEWARIVAWFTKPGGRFYFAEGHPVAWVFDGDRDGMPTFVYPYGNPHPDIMDDPRDYADPTAVLKNTRTWEWMHPLAEILRSLREAGLHVDMFREHYEVQWKMFEMLEEQGHGMFGWADRPWLPLSFSLAATRKLPKGG